MLNGPITLLGYDAKWPIQFAREAAYKDASVRLLDPLSAHELSRFSVTGGFAVGLRFSRDNKVLAVVKDGASDGDRRAELWETIPPRFLQGITTPEAYPVGLPHQSNLNLLRFSPDSHQIAVAGSDGAVEVWDLANARRKTLWTGNKEKLDSVAFSSDSRKLATTGYGCNMKLWDIETREVLSNIGGRLSGFVGLAFSPGDDRLVTGSLGGSVTLWDIIGQQPQEVGKLKAHKDDVVYVSFLPDGKTLASVCGRHVVRLASTIVCRDRGHGAVQLDASIAGF